MNCIQHITLIFGIISCFTTHTSAHVDKGSSLSAYSLARIATSICSVCGIGYYIWKTSNRRKQHTIKQVNLRLQESIPGTREPLGMDNLGNTCYRNSFLQVLFTASKAMKYISEQTEASELFNTFKACITTYNNYAENALDQANRQLQNILVNRDIIRQGEQEDPDDFFKKLLQALQEDVDSGLLTRKTFHDLSAFFTYTTSSDSYCDQNECSYKLSSNRISTPSPTLYLSSSTSSPSFLSSMKAYFSTEQISGYTHPNRKGDLVGHAITKTTNLHKTPPYFLIVMKANQAREKIRKLGNIPFEMNMADYMTQNNQSIIYRLNGIVCHSGTTDNGHYTALIEKNNNWFYCDDNTVSKVQRSQVVQWLGKGIIQNSHVPTILLYEKSS